MIRIGPAGWSYKDWIGPVYPDPRPSGFDELAFLAAYFNTLEINSTFYRPATRRTAVRWAERIAANDDFSFTLKLWRRFTHDRHERWSTAEVREAREAIDTLLEAQRLSAVLAQFPWSFKRDAQSRAWLNALTTEFGDLPLVVEIRHASWDTAEFFASLAERGIGFVNIDQPPQRTGIAPTEYATSRIGYVRVHGRNMENWFGANAGVNERYDYLYSADELLPWAERVRRIAERTDNVYVVTNNHFQGQAVANAAMLTAMLRGEPIAVPPATIRRYADVLRGFAQDASAALQQ